MTTNAYKDIEKLETDLWQAADNLRAAASGALTFSAQIKVRLFCVKCISTLM